MGAYVRGSEQSDKYWIACAPASAAARPSDEAAAAGVPVGSDIAVWLDAVSSIVAPLALLGLSPQARLGAACLRVSKGLARIPIHSDSYHNTLLQLRGTRRLLLFMPDAAPLLYPAALPQKETIAEKLGWASLAGGASVEGMRTPVAKIDPRSVPHADFPGAENAPAFVVTLEPGDALHLPAGWWHYIETTDFDGNQEELGVSAAASIATASTSLPGGGRVVEHPCAATRRDVYAIVCVAGSVIVLALSVVVWALRSV